jgi:hypothetical protein
MLLGDLAAAEFARGYRKLEVVVVCRDLSSLRPLVPGAI